MLKLMFLTLTALLSPAPAHAQGNTVSLPMEISSPAFKEGDTIPINHTCQGANISPELQWKNPPSNTQSFALIVKDPDAASGIFTHWVAFNITDKFGLSAGVPTFSAIPQITQGRNDKNATGYTGPCPPLNHGPHRYYFHLYALDGTLSLPANASRAELETAMEGHILGRAALMGRYEIK